MPPREGPRVGRRAVEFIYDFVDYVRSSGIRTHKEAVAFGASPFSRNGNMIVLDVNAVLLCGYGRGRFPRN